MEDVNKIRDFLRKNIQSHPSPQNKVFRYALLDCQTIFLLHQTQKKNYQMTDMGQDYLTDYDITDYCIRNNQAFYTIWQTIQVLGDIIKDNFMVYSSQIKSQSIPKLRYSNDDEENLRISHDYLQIGEYEKAINHLQDNKNNSWIAHVLQSLQPEQNTDIKPLNKQQLCLLDFMYLPSLGHGNPYYLQTLQAVAQYPQESIFNWVLAKQSAMSFDGLDWYQTVLSNLRNIFQYNVLQELFNLKCQFKDKLYFGYQQDHSLSCNNPEQNVYADIFININKTLKGPTIEQKLIDLLNFDTMRRSYTPEETVGFTCKKLIITFIAEMIGIKDRQSLFIGIQQMFEHIDKCQNQEANQNFRLELYFQWTNFGLSLSVEDSQTMLSFVIELIQSELSVIEDQNVYAQYAIRLLGIMQYSSNYDMVSQQISYLMNKINDKSLIIFELRKMKFSPEISTKIAQVLGELSEVGQLDLDESMQLIKSLTLPQIQQQESFLGVIRRRMLGNPPRKLLDPVYKDLISGLNEFESLNTQEVQEVQLYRNLIDTYFRGLNQFIPIDKELYQLLNQNSTNELFKKIQEHWSYLLLSNMAKQAETEEQIQQCNDLIKDLLQSDLIRKVENIIQVIQMLPTHREDNFLISGLLQ